jgi:hypothetical protein
MTHVGIKGMVETSWRAAEGGGEDWDKRSGDILDYLGGEVRLHLDAMYVGLPLP